MVISIVTPVFDPDVSALASSIKSVLCQSWPDWQLVLVDDASTDPEVRTLLRSALCEDPRIETIFLSQNEGIAGATNRGLTACRGEFVALLDHDDEIVPEALARVAAWLEADPQTDYLYTDEDHIDPDGRLVGPFLKPDWSPERFRSEMYCCHLSVFRRSLVKAVGGLRSEFDGSQDYDLVMRVTERARTIAHIPEVLYHWRNSAASTSSNPDAKPYAFEAGRRAVQAHLERIGIDGTVESLEHPGRYRTRRRIVDRPLVSIIIPTRGTASEIWGTWRTLITQCVSSVLQRSTYENLEIVCVTDASTPAETLAELTEVGNGRVRIVPFVGAFNFSAKINLGAAWSGGEHLLLLNDDMEVIAPDWIETMLGFSQEAGVGATGAKLLFADGTVQHAGHMHVDGEPWLQLRGYPSDSRFDCDRLTVDRECYGVVGACMMTRREVFDRVGGFCEQLPNGWNDVDYSMKVVSAGLRIIWAAHALLYHFESKSREAVAAASDIEFMRARWGSRLDSDPYVNPQFLTHHHHLLDPLPWPPLS